jgi:hypothetical protein
VSLLYQIPTLESNKKTFDKLLVSAEESNNIYSSWIAELEENSRATREVLQGEAVPAGTSDTYSEAFEQILKIWKSRPLFKSDNYIE